MNTLWVDFETRSRCNLLEKGAYNYAKHESTEILCMSYAFDNDEVVTWLPDQPFPEQIRNFTGLIKAHNAAFDRLIFWHVLGIKFPIEQFYCTAAQARANCMPGSLEQMGAFCNSSMKKDSRGKQLIRLLSIPKADGDFNEDAELMKEMVEYCERDVMAMRSISNSIRQLSEEELLDYHINEHVNERGILIDTDLCEAAKYYSHQELKETQDSVAEIAEGEFTTVRSPKMREWVVRNLGEAAKKLIEYEQNGVKKYSVDKSARQILLDYAEERSDEVPPDVVTILQAADAVWSSSVAKFTRLKNLADDRDHRLRGALVFAGGAATGRSSSYGAQVHNFPRKTFKRPQVVRDDLVNRKDVVPKHDARVNIVLKKMLRPAITSGKNKLFIVCDWAQIEARLTPWLSTNGHDKLEIFRQGIDVYKVNASATFNCSIDDVTDHQRQIGKVQELACGFGGGVGSFSNMGKVYGVFLPEHEAKKMVNAWRIANPWAIPYWAGLERAYNMAMQQPNKPIQFARIFYYYDGVHLWYQLPSGRLLCYPYVKYDDEGNLTYAKCSRKPASTDKEWPRTRLWRGLAAENITQASGNDILRHTKRILHRQGIPVVLDVHDEIVVEWSSIEPMRDARRMAKRIKEIMRTAPDWAADLPLDLDLSLMTRYGK